MPTLTTAARRSLSRGLVPRLPMPAARRVPQGLQRAAGCTCGGGCPRCAASAQADTLTAGGAGRLSGLVLGAANDPAEHAADRIAARALAGAMPVDAAANGGGAPALRRRGTAAGDSAASPAAAPSAPSAEPVPASVGQALAGSGRALAPALRHDMEQRFGHDFSQVRVHDDAAAAQSALDVRALAYTVGHDLVFAPGRYAPGSPEGRRLLAHELAHVTQQQACSGTLRLQRQCNPAWAGLPWAQRVSNAKSAASNAANNQCIADMLDEALTANVTVEESTNSARTIDAAIAAGRYTEWGTLSDLHLNFDRNLNAKTGDPGQYGETRFKTPADNSTISIYIVLGPNALDPVGPQHTQMAAQHEGEHAYDFLSQWAMKGSTPHGATPGEELKIHSEGFSLYFLDLWTINNTTGSFSVSTDFSPMFSNYPSATPAEQDAAFDSLKMFFDVRVAGIPCNVMKFKIWLQMMQNARPAADALVARLNALPGMSLTRGTTPGTHFDATLACS